MLDSVDRPAAWRLLIYTIPSEPSRKRAFIWRELKKVGAVYLRDGVCALPERGSTVEAMGKIAAKIEELGGEPTVIAGAELDARRAQSIIESSRGDREQEYAEVLREGEALLKHVRREMEHREFTFVELEELEADLKKLRGWFQQIQDRDYFGAPRAQQAEALLRRCDEALSAFMEAASDREPAR